MDYNCGMELSARELERYRKHTLLPEVGETGQLKLKNASVLVVGAGGLGSPVCLYLAAAGVGHISLIDGDVVDLSNLQRQVIHDSDHCGMEKVESAALRMRKINPEIQIDLFPEALTEINANHVINGNDLVVDCTDNLPVRFLINAQCVRDGIPMVYGAVFRYEGQVAVFDAKRGPCYRCMYPVIPDESSVPDPGLNGLLATIPGVVGLIQANEVLKLLLGIGDPLIGRLLLFDGLAGETRTVRLQKVPACPECGNINIRG